MAIDSTASLFAGASAMDLGPTQAALSPAVLSAKYGGRMNEAQADAAAKDFESMFISQMVEQMFGDSEGSDAFGNSESSDVYKGLLMDQYGRLISSGGGIGIASYVKQELLKQQEITHERPKTTVGSGT